MEIIPLAGIFTSFAAAVLIVYFVTKARQRRVELQAEMQTKLIDRFGSASEMVAFLQSPAGKEFVSGVQIAPALLTRERLLGGFTRAIVLTSLGIAFLFLSIWADDAFVIPAAIILSLGIGFFLATALSYKLSATLYTNREPNV